MTLSTAKYIFAVVGLVILLGSLAVYGRTASFAHRAATAQGTVTALVPQESTAYATGNGSVSSRSLARYVYQPVVRFRHDGQWIEFNDSEASNPPAFHVGETVTVLYLESNPYDARIDSFISLWLAPMIFGGIGAILLALGTALILHSRPANP
jgi:hypothetical protein